MRKHHAAAAPVARRRAHAHLLRPRPRHAALAQVRLAAAARQGGLEGAELLREVWERQGGCGRRRRTARVRQESRRRWLCRGANRGGGGRRSVQLATGAMRPLLVALHPCLERIMAPLRVMLMFSHLQSWYIMLCVERGASVEGTG
jgi:hypothetical protein